MTSSTNREATIAGLAFRSDKLVVNLADGRQLVTPLDWFPRLRQGTAAERRKWRLLGGGLGVHWPLLDEDISLANLLAGQRSGESATSLRAWSKKRVKPPRRRSRIVV